MTVKEIYNSLDGTLLDVDRERILRPLMGVLTPVSLKSLQVFQAGWPGRERSYEDFVIAQDGVLRNCLDIEITEIGAAVRKVFGAEPLTWETEIVIDESEREIKGVTDESE